MSWLYIEERERKRERAPAELAPWFEWAHAPAFRLEGYTGLKKSPGITMSVNYFNNLLAIDRGGEGEKASEWSIF
jgi:hypothetical protein